MPLYTRGGQSSYKVDVKTVALSNVYICQIVLSTFSYMNILSGNRAALKATWN